MAVTLTVTAGPHAERTFAFDRHDTLLVGRAKDAHFQLSYDDPYFSRRHFLVEVREILQIPPPRLVKKIAREKFQFAFARSSRRVVRRAARRVSRGPVAL
jgi:pSer/pThr/pTyr-binding forkhead associated (FHA) protein